MNSHGRMVASSFGSTVLIVLCAVCGVARAEAPQSATFSAGPVNVTLNGFVEMMIVNRSTNEAADWASNYNTSISFPNSHNYYLSESHLTERQSRVAALVQGPSDPNVAIEGYLETDFGGTTSNGNYNETGSYSPRVRHLFADYQSKTGDWYLLFGQAWSLVTAEKFGMMPRDENIVPTIDGQYIPGFDWLRVPQVRLVKKFGGTLALGVSIENPAVLVTAGSSAGAPAIPSVYNAAGASSAFATGVNVTTDRRPDVVAKVGFDPGYGHYELFGYDREFRSRTSVGSMSTPASWSNVTNTATGIGGSLLVPVVPKLLDFSGSFISGKGVGRYGSAQLADATLNPGDGSVTPIKGYHFLAGLILRPTPALTMYAFVGREHDDLSTYSFTTGGKTYLYGYGVPAADNSGCEVEGGTCDVITKTISEATLGGWYKFYQGALGNAQVGIQLTNVRREAFADAKGFGPSTHINIGLISFRYYPYQK
jgi:hypothetical protein